MNECLGKYFVKNGLLTEVANFDDSFIAGPDYIYEVFRVIDGIALFLEDHLARLDSTCNLSGHGIELDTHSIALKVYELISANQLTEGNIKVVVTQSPNSLYDCLIYTTDHLYPTPEQYEYGVVVKLQKGIRHNPNAKIMDVALRRAANNIKIREDVYETLLVDGQGCITEGSRSNVFFVRENKVITPPLSDVLPGITRKHVINACTNIGIEVIQEKVLARSVIIMEAIFITGTSRMVLPVSRIDDIGFDAGHPAICKIKSEFLNYVNNYLEINRFRKL